MFYHTISQKVSTKTLINWLLLSFLSGSVNAGGFLACERFVTHVTGFATLFGIELAHGRLDAAFGILTVPLYFLLGVMGSAYLVDRPFHQGKRPHYATVMALVALCLVAASLLGHLAFFGDFGGGLQLKQNYILLALLCMASGLQNGAITTSSGGSIRSTHLTGVTTDLGIGLVRAYALPTHPAHHRRELRAAWLRVGLIISFGLGGAASTLLFLRWQHLGFLFPATIAAYTAVAALGGPRDSGGDASGLSDRHRLPLDSGERSGILKKA